MTLSFAASDVIITTDDNNQWISTGVKRVPENDVVYNIDGVALGTPLLLSEDDVPVESDPVRYGFDYSWNVIAVGELSASVSSLRVDGLPYDEWVSREMP